MIRRLGGRFLCAQNLSLLATLYLAALTVLVHQPAKAQVVYGISGITTTTTPVQGLSDTELDYAAYYYYDPRTDGFLSANGAIVASRSVVAGYGGCSYGYACSYFTMSAPNSPLPSTTYQTQTNHWVRAYWTEVVNSTIVYEDVYGFSLIGGGNYGGNATIDPNDVFTTTYFTDYFVGSTYISYKTAPEPNPIISAIQVNGAVTNTIIAGTSGYMSIYGQYLDGATSVTAPPGVSITSFQVYNNGTQLNAFFQAAAGAATGQHNVTVNSPHGTSNGSATVTVVVNVTKLVFTNSVPYSRDCAGNATPIAQPTWPAPAGVACPQELGYTGDHAVFGSGTAMTGTVTFSVSPAPSQGVTGMYVQGAIPGVGNFAASGVSITANATTFSASVSANAALPASQTHFYNPMSVTWSVGQSGTSCSSGCVAVGTSSNPVYVTLGPSVLPAFGQPLMLTYISLGVGSGGLTSQGAAISSTWSEFFKRERTGEYQNLGRPPDVLLC